MAMQAALGLALLAQVAFSSDVDEGRTAVNKVITILRDMKDQLEKESGNDEEVMDQMICWCETNDKSKTKAISDGQQKVKVLTAAIEQYSNSATSLKEEISQGQKDIAANMQELSEASAIRDKEQAEFAENEKQQASSVSGLTNAIKSIGARTGMALRQQSLMQVDGELEGLSSIDASDAKLRQMGIPPKQRRMVQAFLQSKSHNPASAEVFGVLKQMKESFESSLKESQTEEADAVKAYKQLKGAKSAELQAAQDQVDAKSAQMAEAVERLAQSKQDLKDTTRALESDSKFLADLKDRCSNMDLEFAERSKTRALEIKAVGQALAILSADDARDQFGKSTKFVQIRSNKNGSRARQVAAKLVLTTAASLKSPQLAALASSIRTDVFSKVKKAIDGMLQQLKQENQDEIEHRDWCIDELNQNERQTDDAYDSKKELETQQEDLNLFLQNVDSEIAAANAEINDMKVQLKQASENRAKENKDFQETVMDQHATQELLTKALEKLKDFYSKQALVEVQSGDVHAKKSGQAPPPGFASYKKNAGATGVMMMLEGIIKESKTVEQEAQAGEQEAQAAYEAFIKDTNEAIESLEKGVTAKEVAKSRSAGDMARTSADLKAQLKTLEELSSYSQELHLSCSFTIKNFEIRQNARAKEMEALKQAKAVMSGAELR